MAEWIIESRKIQEAGARLQSYQERARQVQQAQARRQEEEEQA